MPIVVWPVGVVAYFTRHSVGIERSTREEFKQKSAKKRLEVARLEDCKPERYC